MFIKVKVLTPTAQMPTHGSPSAAGYDLYADVKGTFNGEDKVLIPRGKTVKVGTGLAMELPEGYGGFIFARSGLSIKDGLRPANCVGLCDSDYRGEYIVALHNDGEHDIFVEHGARIAQLVVMAHQNLCFEEVEELDDTERGEGGFGSTGK